MADFIAIDFETASRNTNSACSIGIAVVDNLQIVDSFSSLIHPCNSSFDARNIQIHGITSDMVESSPTLDELWPAIQKWFSPHTPVVAHNAHFDMSVLHESSNVEILNFPYVDTIAMVKPLMDGSHDLEHCADFFGIDIGHHHDAADDARVCAEIAIKVIEKFECRTMWEFLARENFVSVNDYASLVPRKTIGAGKSRNRFIHLQVHPSDIQPTVSVIEKRHPFYGKIIVFTGQLSIERAEAMQMAVNVGAINKSSVSSKTDYLVVGIQDKQLVGEDGKSTKEEKAYALNAAGKANVKIIGEDEFMRIVKGGCFV